MARILGTFHAVTTSVGGSFVLSPPWLSSVRVPNKSFFEIAELIVRVSSYM